MPTPSTTPVGDVVVNVTATVPPVANVNSLLAAPPGLTRLENELRSMVAVVDGDVAVDVSVHEAPRSARQQNAASLTLMGV